MNEAMQSGSGDGLCDAIVLEVYRTDTLYITWGSVLNQNAGATLDYLPLGSDGYMLLFVSRGSLNVKVGPLLSEEPDYKPDIDTSGNFYDIKQGQTLIIGPSEWCIGASSHKSSIFCPFIYFRLKHRYRGSSKANIRVPRVSSVRDPQRMNELFSLVTEDYHEHQAADNFHPVSAESSQHMLFSLLARLDAEETNSPPTPGQPAILVERAKDYIRMHLADHLSSETVAQALDCSAGYLRWAFHNSSGEGINDYVLRKRMQWARHRLVWTRLSVGQIARTCGFSDANYFTRTFARVHGMPPTQYRAAHIHNRVDAGI